MLPFLDPASAGMFFGPFLADDDIRTNIEQQIAEWLSVRNIAGITVWESIPNPDDTETGQTIPADELPRIVLAFAAATFGFSLPGYELPGFLLPR